jgi:hypothetical protein
VNRRTRRSTVIMLATLVLPTLPVAAGGSPARATCPAPGVACLAGETARAGRGLIGRTVGPLDTPAADRVPPVVDTVAPVVSAILGRANDVIDRVNDLMRSRDVGPPDHVGGDGKGRTPSAGQNGRETTTTRASGEGIAARDPFLADPGFAEAPPTTISAASGVSPARPSFEGFGDALRGAAPSLAIVLAFFLLAVAFIAIQVRLDRKDPRLSLAPLESDVVDFV